MAFIQYILTEVSEFIMYTEELCVTQVSVCVYVCVFIPTIQHREVHCIISSLRDAEHNFKTVLDFTFSLFAAGQQLLQRQSLHKLNTHSLRDNAEVVILLTGQPLTYSHYSVFGQNPKTRM